MRSAASRNRRRPAHPPAAISSTRLAGAAALQATFIEAEIGVARELDIARRGHPRRDLGRAFARRRPHQVGGRHGGHIDQEVEPVDKRPRKAAEILGDAALVGRAPAGEARLVGRAAAAGVHRRDQLEARRIDDAVVGARDRDFAGLDRLAQAVENLRLELRQFVEEEHAVDGRAKSRRAWRARRRRPGPACEAE